MKGYGWSKKNSEFKEIAMPACNGFVRKKWATHKTSRWIYHIHQHSANNFMYMVYIWGYGDMEVYYDLFLYGMNLIIMPFMACFV